MKIISVGKIKKGPLFEIKEDYSFRIGKYIRLENIIIKEETKKEIEKNLEIEKEQIIDKIKEEDFVVCCDREGKSINSIEFSKIIKESFIYNKNLVFIIGGSNGLHPKVKKRANLVLSFSKLTFPHQLFYLILLEQIYRSLKIINNETYHK